ncbi:hypothetical protein T265_03126, partial [Opisthorchis viverrini]
WTRNTAPKKGRVLAQVPAQVLVQVMEGTNEVVLRNTSDTVQKNANMEIRRATIRRNIYPLMSYSSKGVASKLLMTWRQACVPTGKQEQMVMATMHHEIGTLS